MGKHSRDIGPVVSDYDRVIRVLAKQIDAYRADQMVGWIRSESEAKSDIQEIIDDAWQEVAGDTE